MATYLIWAIAGFALIIVELLTGTFYLLVIGIAALIGALVAYLGGGLWAQVIIAGAAALIGTYLVHRWWLGRPQSTTSSNNLEIGHTVILESWVNQAAGMARVKYRGSTWDAHVEGSAMLEDVLYIHDQRNGVLDVSAQRA